MRLLVDQFPSAVATPPSPGLDAQRWTSPVRAGDLLGVRVTVLDSRPPASKPPQGVVRSPIEARNQHGVPVMSTRSVNLFLRRPVATAARP